MNYFHDVMSSITKYAIFFIVFLILILQFGCASQIMKSYIGKDVREVVLDYGPPANALDMGTGQRAFQWARTQSFTTPATARTTGNINYYRNNAWYSSQTIVTGGNTTHATCLYTLMTTWDEQRKGWIVTDFRRPNILCE